MIGDLRKILVVEYRVERHRTRLGERLEPLEALSDPGYLRASFDRGL